MPNTSLTIKKFGDLNPTDNPADFGEGLRAQVAREWIIEGNGFLQAMKGRKVWVKLPPELRPVLSFIYANVKGVPMLFVAGNGLIAKIEDFSDVDTNGIVNVALVPNGTGNAVVNYAEEGGTYTVSGTKVTITDASFYFNLRDFREGDYFWDEVSTKMAKIVNTGVDANNQTVLTLDRAVSSNTNFKLVKAIQSKLIHFYEVGESVIVLPSLERGFRYFGGEMFKLQYPPVTGGFFATSTNAGTSTKFSFAITAYSSSLFYETAPMLQDFTTGKDSTVTITLNETLIPPAFDLLRLYRFREGYEADYYLIQEVSTGTFTNSNYGRVYTLVDDTSQFDVETNDVWQNQTIGRMYPNPAFIGTVYRNSFVYANIFEEDGADTIWFSLPFDPPNILVSDFQIIKKDGGQILQLAEVESGLLVFRDKDIWLLYGNIGAMQGLKLHDKGIRSTESVLKLGSSVVFASEDGLYITTGRQKKKLSNLELSRFIRDKMTEDDYENITIGEKDGFVLLSY